MRLVDGRREAADRAVGVGRGQVLHGEVLPDRLEHITGVDVVALLAPAPAGQLEGLPQHGQRAHVGRCRQRRQPEVRLLELGRGALHDGRRAAARGLGGGGRRRPPLVLGEREVRHRGLEPVGPLGAALQLESAGRPADAQSTAAAAAAAAESGKAASRTRAPALGHGVRADQRCRVRGGQCGRCAAVATAAAAAAAGAIAAVIVAASLTLPLPPRRFLVLRRAFAL